jgi:hypothetical protein
VASPGTLSDSARSFKQSRDSVKTQTIRTVLVRVALAIRVARTTGELIEITGQLWMAGRQSHSMDPGRGQHCTTHRWKLLTRLGG